MKTKPDSAQKRPGSARKQRLVLGPVHVKIILTAPDKKGKGDTLEIDFPTASPVTIEGSRQGTRVTILTPLGAGQFGFQVYPKGRRR